MFAKPQLSICCLEVKPRGESLGERAHAPTAMGWRLLMARAGLYCITLLTVPLAHPVCGACLASAAF